MAYLKISLSIIALFLIFESNAQSKTNDLEKKNSFLIKIDSLEINIYNNYESDTPPIDLNNLREPTLFILNDTELNVSKFSELKIKDKKIESVKVIQNPAELKEMGYNRYNSIIKIVTEEKE